MSKFKNHFRLSPWTLMIIISVLYLLLIWLGYRQVERTLNHQRLSGHVFRPGLGQDGGLQLYVQECPNVYSHRRLGHVYDYRNTERSIFLKPDMCPVPHKFLKSNIQMEQEWKTISVGYPQYVYTVSGWIQVIHVPNYVAKPLKVIIVPHSHQDPGWKNTFEGYYRADSSAILDNIVTYLSQNPKWKFIWSEISFLEKWFSEAGTKKEQFKRLVENGQLEIVTGGWVMTDEAVSHYSAMLDQLTEGHQWLRSTLGIVPNTSWSVDPFGHSPTMTYLLKTSGIENMVIQRVHFAIKRHFAKKQSLEFIWRQAWDSTGVTGVLCHMMPFLLYSIHYSCGPDPHVCCQFDFHSDKCYRGTKSVQKLTVDDSNIRKLAWALWEQFQKKSQLYKSNVLLVPHGDDFRYRLTIEWDRQFGNLVKLMDYMNKNEDMNIQLEFGTISDYFNALKLDAKKESVSFPSLTGDFLPYNDRDDQYWTGFYSVRPLLKYMGRVLQAKLRNLEIYFALICAQSALDDREFYMKQVDTLTEARRTLGLFHHHDAITGTSIKVVMKDYGTRVQNSITKVDTLFKTLVYYAAAMNGQTNASLQTNSIHMHDKWTAYNALPSLRVSQFDEIWTVIVTNPLTIPWKSVVIVRTTTPSVVRTKLDVIRFQINPVIGLDLMPVMGLYDIAFEASLEPLSMKVYYMVEQPSPDDYASVTVYGRDLDPTIFVYRQEFNAKKSEKKTIDIENDLLRATFSSCTGTLQYTLQKLDDVVHQTSIQMVTYGTGSWANPFRDKSGAYVFMPDGHAKEVQSHYPKITVIKGEVMSSVTSLLEGVTHQSVLYNITGPVAAGLHIHNTARLVTPDWDNKELAMRVVSDVTSPDTSICVDLNGYQMHKKKWKSKFLIQGNFHPVTSTAFIEDGNQARLSLLMSSPHGVASLNQGWLEVILDRRLIQDDWRGLNEGAQDNVDTASDFFLLLERRDKPGKTKGPVCYPSLLSHLLLTHLNNPPQVAFLKDPELKPAPEVLFTSESWSCVYYLPNLRFLGSRKHPMGGSVVDTLMLLHRVGIDCSFSQLYCDCDMQTTMRLNRFLNTEMVSARHTTLTGVKEVEVLTELTAELTNMEIKAFNVTFR